MHLLIIKVLHCLLMMQWPGAYCDSNQSCCYPITPILPAEFNIYGLRPTKNDGSTPSNCDIQSVFDKSKVLIYF